MEGFQVLRPKGGAAYVESLVQASPHFSYGGAHISNPLDIIVDENVGHAFLVDVVLIDSARVVKNLLDLGVSDEAGRVCAWALFRVRMRSSPGEVAARGVASRLSHFE